MLRQHKKLYASSIQQEFLMKGGERLMLNFNSILIFSENPKILAGFYAKVFDKKPEMSDQDWTGFLVGSGFISFGPHDMVKGKSKNPERIIFNLESDDVAGEFGRIKALGATVIAKPYHPSEDEQMWIATFADPDGNYFQVVTPWKG